MNTQKVSTFSVTLDKAMHSLARQFYREQSNPRKGKQVYLNTLAVLAVNYYLRCLNIETELEAGNSWDEVMQSLADVADLKIKNGGRIECRPVLPDSNTCHVPAETWTDRIGYVAVRFDRELTEASLLGFLPEIKIEDVTLDRFRSLADLIEYLSLQERDKPVTLNQWLEGIFHPLWIDVDAIFSPRVAYQFMSDSSPKICRGKEFNLGLHFQDKKVALVICLTPNPKEDLIEILAQLCPVENDRYLPARIKLALLTQEDEVIREVEARNSDFLIRLDRYSYRVGRKMRLRVSLSGSDVEQSIDRLWSVTEDFLI